MNTMGFAMVRDGLKAISLVEERAAPTKRASADDAATAELQAPLKRFRRNAVEPAELEDLRHKLIQARVMNGFSIEDAAVRFREAGLPEHVDLSEIESGRADTPRGWVFIKLAAEIYAVSSDWLIGLSIDATRDCKVAMTRALLRGTEGVVTGLLTQFVSAMEQTAQAVQITPAEVSDLIGAIEDVVARFEKFSAHESFEDMPGGAAVAASIQRLAGKIAPLRRVHAKFSETAKLFDALRAGKLNPIPWLVAEDDPQAAATEARGEGDSGDE
ncbi:hypothetical protein SAMN05414139_02919 [Burkholderia sp. D7]|nr:hypothetical protein SAMN05414139_02919 [Burkholderia sp. D7]